MNEKTTQLPNEEDINSNNEWIEAIKKGKHTIGTYFDEVVQRQRKIIKKRTKHFSNKQIRGLR